MGYSGKSAIQQEAEEEILRSLSTHLRIDVESIEKKRIEGVDFDGYVVIDGTPHCIEIWAHQGKAKGAQKFKLMNDVCKLMLFEKLCRKKCRKIVCVTDKDAVSFLYGKGWQGKFFEMNDIEALVVDISEKTRSAIVEIQKTQNMNRVKSNE